MLAIKSIYTLLVRINGYLAVKIPPPEVVACLRYPYKG